MQIKAPKGTKDILPREVYKWQYIEKILKQVCACFGYNEIRLPVFEHTELFQRGVGDTTDIVQKEMYTFLDKGGRSITLRPEGTAGVVRSYIEHGMSSLTFPQKLYYNITAYRYERMQKGRYREFNQFGVEVFGSKGPDIDVEVIAMIKMILDKLGIQGLELNINSIGCPSCRGEYNKKLKKYLSFKIDNMCGTCKDRYDRNPLRILDCKEEKCKLLSKDTPSLLDSLCEGCENHFEAVKKGLENLEIFYKIDNSIVRGLDYYTKTVFEFVSGDIGSQGTVCGGGRYDGLVKECGGIDTPGVGFGMGLERILLVMEEKGIIIPRSDDVLLYVATIGQKAKLYMQKLINSLRSSDLSVETDYMERSIKAQMKYADKIGANYVIVVGDSEIENKKVILKNMRTKEQEEVQIDLICDKLKCK